MAIKTENKPFYTKDWEQISKETIIKKGNVCEICKKIGIKRNVWLTVHHKDRNPTNNKDENLLVCCPYHHFQQERLINTGYFNSKQEEML